MIQKINFKYFSPFTPIANLSKNKSKNLERILFSQGQIKNNQCLIDSFTKMPEIFY